MKYNLSFASTVLSIIIFTLCLAPLRGNAQGIKSFTPEPVVNEMARTAFSFNYQFLSGQEMKSSYTDGLYGVHLQRLTWEWDQFGLFFGGGIIGGEGSGKVIDPTWTVVTNDLGFWALDFEGTLIARLPGELPFKTITPFVGLGIDGFVATEKLSVTIQKDTATGYFPKIVRGDASALRTTVAGHVLLGVLIPVGKDNSLEVDFKALFSASTGFHDFVTADQETTLEREIYSVIKRPAFNLSGYSIRLGITI